MTERYRKEHPFIGAMKDFIDATLAEYPNMSLKSFARIVDGLSRLDEVEKAEARQLEKCYNKAMEEAQRT